MKIKIDLSCNDNDLELLDLIDASSDDLIRWIDKAMPCIVRAFFKESLKNKEKFDHASKKKA